MPASVPVSVEVSVSEVLQGVVEIRGELQVDEQGLTFVYQTTNAKAQKAPVETLDLPLAQLHGVTVKRRVLGATIRVQTRRPVTFEYVAGVSRNELVFLVKHPHRQQAATVVADLQGMLTDRDREGGPRLPFRLPDANLGVTEISGTVYLDADWLVFEVRSGVSGGSRKKQEVVKIEPRALEAIHLERGTLRDRLVVRPKTRDLFRAMPGMYKDKEVLTMKLARRYRAEAAQLVDEIRRLRALTE